MTTIQIGHMIATNRKMKGITQEELANHLGVSKPAVSKWESGQSYPDILLLPELASYFNITVDQLIGYEPQMTKEDVNKLYHKLAEAFSREPFEKVYDEVLEYIRKYFSCWQLQHQLGILLINHSSLAGSPERMNEVLERALEIFLRVEKSCEDVPLAKQALQMEALCHLSLQRPSEAIDILENMYEHQMSTESLLVRAYEMKGDIVKAKEHLHGYTFVNLITILDSAGNYFQLYANQSDRIDQYYHLFTKLCELFEVEQLHPAMLVRIHLAAAIAYMGCGNKKAAMEVLEKYADLIIRSNKGNFTFHSNRIFDALDGYLNGAEIDGSMPRSSEVIWNDLKKVVFSNPVFAELEAEPQYQQMKRRLES